MKRNMNLVYEILSRVEEQARGGMSYAPSVDRGHAEYKQWTQDDIRYHVVLCVEAGLVVVGNRHDSKDPVAIDRLTWSGHDLLEKLRRER